MIRYGKMLAKRDQILDNYEQMSKNEQIRDTDTIDKYCLICLKIDKTMITYV
jgi:hypothetical protein